MLKNYFKIALRNIQRHKRFAFLNIAGLAIGMACSILILLWVQNELSYDRFHKNAEQIYRLTCNVGDFSAAVSPAGMAEGLQNTMPEIKSTVRLSKQTTILFEAGALKFEEKRGFYADSNFLQIFSFPLVKGDPATALYRPDGILITESMAKKYFGNEEPLGKVLRKDNSENCIVTGILSDIRPDSHLQFDFILPMSSILNSVSDLRDKVWTNYNFYSYILLDRNATSAELIQFNLRTEEIYKTHNANMKVNFHLQPLTSIHLHSNLQIDVTGHGNKQYVNIFFIVALFILAVACINFMNLATARSARRAREVGLRKVVGAGRPQLILQFLGESLVISFFSLLLAIGIVFLLLPSFNFLSGKELSIQLLDGKLLVSLLAISILTGLIAGSYPALYLSGFRPINVLKGETKPGRGDLIFRNGLVVAQFVIAIVLLVGTAAVYQQLTFIKNKNLGFDKSNLLYVPMTGDIWGKQQALKSTLQQNPLTREYTIISDLPASLITGTIDVQWEGRDPNSQIVIPSMDVDENFFDVFQATILTGRGFSSRFPGDSTNYVVNEKALQTMGFNINNAVGKNLVFGGAKGMIIGVVKDFNFKPLQYAIDPLILRLNRYGGLVIVRTSPGNTATTIDALEKMYTELNPAYPFSYNFLDSDLENQYNGEQQMSGIFNLFAILAIFISSLGLYGLSSFMAEQRTKEIGVRKVLGASVFNIVFLLSGKFTKLIIISMLIAIPVSGFAINSWLDDFAYRIDISWIIFAAASITALLIAWLTVSYESIKAAMVNPVVSLRSE